MMRKGKLNDKIMETIFNNTLVISFVAQGVAYTKTIKKSEIDIEHYDTLWDWWGGDTDSVYDNMLDFELTGNKDDDDNLIADDNLYLNVYERDGDNIIETIHDITIIECN